MCSGEEISNGQRRRANLILLDHHVQEEAGVTSADYPRTGTFAVEWVDAAEPGEPSNFGWFSAGSDPPLTGVRLRALLSTLIEAVDQAEAEEPGSDGLWGRSPG